MKKVLGAVAMMLLVVLTACGGAGESSSEMPTTEASAETSAETSAEAAAGQTAGTALEDKVLDIGTNATLPPYEYYEGNEMVGIDIDLMQAIADELGYQLKMHDMEFDSIISSIQSGKLDGGAAALSVTPEREQNVNFTDSYDGTRQMVIVMKDATETQPEDLKGKKVGSQLGSTGEQAAKELLGEDAVSAFSKFQDAVLAMQSGKINAVVCDEETATRFVEANADLKLMDAPLKDETLAIALTKDNDKLLEEVQSALQTLKDNGALQEIMDKYKDVK